MSGVEIAGLVLGAFPLLTWAMEYYEDNSNIPKTWWKFRRAHRKDLGRIKDAQLNFKLTLKHLLMQLWNDDVLARPEYEALLADPGGAGWKTEDVNEALAVRLDECQERYIEIMQCMVETMLQLREVAKVDDSQFQQHLAREVEKRGTTPNASVARTKLLCQANNYLAFQAKRTKYAFTGVRRDALLNDLEQQNKTLDELLAKCDKLSELSKRETQPPLAKGSTKSLLFWRHAASIYSVIRDAWQCKCRSCANLWLQPPVTSNPYMNVVLSLCHGRQSIHIKLNDTPPTLQLGVPMKKSSKGGKTVLQDPFAPLPRHARSAAVSTTNVSSSTTTVTSSSSSAISAASQSGQGVPLPPNSTRDLKTEGLCKAFSSAHPPDSCLGNLVDGDNEYMVFPASQNVLSANRLSLAEILGTDSPSHLTRVQRYCVALNIASSHLQLHPTQWIKEYWTSDDIYFPLSRNNSVTKLHEEPYIFSRFESPVNASPLGQRDRSFSTLGIVLLELCFGRLLASHVMWESPVYAPLKDDPMIRQTVACEWLNDVEGEAGEDYSKAVSWTLKQAPAVLKDEKWREEFARNVVQPLQRYYDYLHPRKTS